MIKDLEIEYLEILKKYYELGGTEAYLTQSGIKKTFIKS